MEKHPTLGNGKICYLEIPAINVAESAEFFSNVFGWTIRNRGDGATAFDDGVTEVSGTWVTNVKPSEHPGIMIYIMVKNMDHSLQMVKSHGGQILDPGNPDSKNRVAKMKDPAGNIFGLYQDPSL